VKTTVATPPVVAILYPHRDQWLAEFVQKQWIPLVVRPLDWCKKLHFLCRVPSLPVARNTLVREALATDATHFLWVDGDNVVETQGKDPNQALRVLYEAMEQSGESIVTGLYRAKQKHGFNYAIWNRGERRYCRECRTDFPNAEYQVQPEWGTPCPKCGKGVIEKKTGFVHIGGWSGNWFEVDVCGAGFLLMRRKVFEDLQQIVPRDEAGEYSYFHWETPDSMSEDFWMLMQAKKLGYKAWCLTDVKLSHAGMLVIETGGNVRVPEV